VHLVKPVDEQRTHLQQSLNTTKLVTTAALQC